MVRLSGSAAVVADGLRVPGVYRALLESERMKVAKAERVWVRPGYPDEGFFERSTSLLEALEAGLVVVVPSWCLGGHSVPCNDAFKEFKRRQSPRPVAWVVAPNDVVRPWGEQIAFPGRAFDEIGL